MLRNMERMDENRAIDLLATLDHWSRRGDAISRELVFAGFADAVAFVVRLGFAAEAADHHPDLLIRYKRVTVTYSTHSAGGLTEKDFEGARAVDALARRFAPG
jgi:4a-hydroxytetrahydrobiopterin dehydratase